MLCEGLIRAKGVALAEVYTSTQHWRSTLYIVGCNFCFFLFLMKHARNLAYQLIFRYWCTLIHWYSHLLKNSLTQRWQFIFVIHIFAIALICLSAFVLKLIPSFICLPLNRFTLYQYCSFFLSTEPTQPVHTAGAHSCEEIGLYILFSLIN